jgi:hypothetical protein
MNATTTREQAAILDAIRTVTTYYRAEWASLSAVRDESQLTRATFDVAMTELALAGLVVLVPEDNQKTLSSADRHNALHIGGEHKHLAQIA